MIFLHNTVDFACWVDLLWQKVVFATAQFQYVFTAVLQSQMNTVYLRLTWAIQNLSSYFLAWRVICFFMYTTTVLLY